MLAVSETAATLVRTLAEDSPLPDIVGLRIDIDTSYDSLFMRLTSHARPGDAVVEAHGATVFLSPSAAERLSQQILRADITDGRRSFFIDEG